MLPLSVVFVLTRRHYLAQLLLGNDQLTLLCLRTLVTFLKSRLLMYHLNSFPHRFCMFLISHCPCPHPSLTMCCPTQILFNKTLSQSFLKICLHLLSLNYTLILPKRTQACCRPLKRSLSLTSHIP